MNNPAQILLVDDDEADVEAIQRAFHQEELNMPITTAMDGKDAWAILQGEAGASSLSTPYLILLDINMSSMKGLEFLRKVRSDPELNRTIVFVLSNSDNPDLVKKAYQNHISGYIHKDKLRTHSSELVYLLHQFQKLNQFPPC
jgi:CheY-like chemotaxis protein